MPRPDAATLDGFVSYLEHSIDRDAAAHPRPGRTALHRLNRAEYANAIRDLLALEIDSTALLPPDDESSGFDNIADVLSVSPSLMERYLSASWNISRAALGNLNIQPSTITHRVRPDLSQDQHIEGLPPGTRGGMLVEHTFPVDAEYVIKLRMWRNTFDLMRGMEDPHDIEIAMDGKRLAVVTVGGREDFGTMAENPGTFGAELDRKLTVRLPVKAGTHTLWATTVLKSHAPRDDLIKPFIRTTVDGLDIMGDPSVDRITVEGPFAPTSPGDTASRRKILSCKPAAAAQEQVCARQILTGLARQAYRKPVDRTTVDVLMDFYGRGRKTGGSFERGIESALQFILASPEFLYRVEPDPPSRSALRRDGSPAESYQLGDVAIASRLSFFLWSSPARRAAHLARVAGKTEAAGGLRAAGSAPAGRSPLADAHRQFRRAVAAPAQPEDRQSRSGRIPGFRRQPPAGDEGGDGVVRRQHHARGPQRDGPVERGLHVRQRTAGAALRHPEHLRQSFPPGAGAERGAPRSARSGEHSHRDVVSESHLAG
jgi:hypothetical protein